MSTKIYNGYILSKEMSFFELHELFNKMKKDIQVIRDEILHSKIVSLATRLYDDIYVFGNSELDSFYGKEAYDYASNYLSFGLKLTKLRADRILREQCRDSDYDFEASAVIYTLESGKILLTFYAENTKIQEYFKSIEDFKEYMYWDNTDSPEELSDKEWEQRGKDWNEAFKDFWIPNEAGYVVSFSKGDVNSFGLEFNNSMIPNMQKRIKRIAKETLRKEFFMKLKTTDETAKKDVWKYVDYIGSEKYQEDLEKMMIYLEDKIPELSIEILKTPIDGKEKNDKKKNIVTGYTVYTIDEDVFEQKYFQHQEKAEEYLNVILDYFEHNFKRHNDKKVSIKNLSDSILFKEYSFPTETYGGFEMETKVYIKEIKINHEKKDA